MFGRKRADDDVQPEVKVVADDGLSPSVMRGTEPMYGYLVAIELAVVAVLNLVITHGKGAPKHPSRPIELVGLIATLALVGLIQTRQRFVVGFGTMMATLLIVLPAVPYSLQVIHLIALVIAFVYGYTLTRRQSKAKLAEGRPGRTGASAPKQTAAERRAQVLVDRQAKRDKRRGVVSPTGPKANRRYTPPKRRRARPGSTTK